MELSGLPGVSHAGFGANRAEVGLNITNAATAYIQQQTTPQPQGPGAIEESVTYEIKDNKVIPAPTVDLPYGTVQGDDGVTPYTVFETVIDAIYRDNGVQKFDATKNEFYVLYSYVVLAHVNVRNIQGQLVPAFQWSSDPNFDQSQSPPCDPATGTQGFAFNPLWTSIAL